MGTKKLGSQGPGFLRFWHEPVFCCSSDLASWHAPLFSRPCLACSHATDQRSVMHKKGKVSVNFLWKEWGTPFVDSGQK